MREFLFLRHGETDWNVENRMQGRTHGVPLNETGRKQAEKAASLLARQAFDVIVSSPLDRAAMTARIIGEKKKCPLVFDERLIERSWGEAEGMTHKEMHTADPALFAENGPKDWITKMRQPKGAETKEELMARASSSLFDLLKSYDKERLLLVTHGAWLRALVFSLTGLDQIFPNAVPYAACEDGNVWRIRQL